MTLFTVLGAGGMIGGALAVSLERQGHDVRRIDRAGLPRLLEAREPAGHVISCIGLTGDFRSRPYATAEAHVGVTAGCLAGLRCDSFLFLSSTRVYARAAATQEETPLPCLSSDPSDLYNLSKLTGEALCLADPRPACRVVRLSNVYGPGADDTFLGQVLAEGRASGSVRFRQAPASEKDYIALETVVDTLPLIAVEGGTGCITWHPGRTPRMPPSRRSSTAQQDGRPTSPLAPRWSGFRASTRPASMQNSRCR